MIPLDWYLYTAALLMVVGLFAVTRRQNVIMILIGIAMLAEQAITIAHTL